jgi:glycosyltransferase involved in cell wall biosynthesis
LKILQVCPYFYPYLAGQEIFVLELSKQLIKSGHSVTVYTSNHSYLPVYEKIQEIDVFRFKMIFNPLNNPICPGFFNIYKKIRDFDIIHVHNEHSFVTLITYLINLFLKKPIVLTCHGQLRFDNYWKDLFEKIYSRTVGKFIFDNIDKVAALSDSDKKYLISIGVDPVKIVIIPNAINHEYLDNISYNKKMQEKNDEKILLYVGVLIKRKGVEYLIRSIPDIIKHNRVSCIIVGKGDYREQLETLVDKLNLADNIIFKGSVSTEELYFYYNTADIFVLPSVSEGLPTTILEAMYFGLPVVTTDIPGIRDHFSDSAILVPPKNEKELANAIIRVLNDLPLRESLSGRGKELVREKYTWDKVSNAYINIYHELLKNNI